MTSGAWYLWAGESERFSRISINSKAELFLWAKTWKDREPQYSKSSLMGEYDVTLPSLVESKLAPHLLQMSSSFNTCQTNTYIDSFFLLVTSFVETITFQSLGKNKHSPNGYTVKAKLAHQSTNFSKKKMDGYLKKQFKTLFSYFSHDSVTKSLKLVACWLLLHLHFIFWG